MHSAHSRGAGVVISNGWNRSVRMNNYDWCPIYKCDPPCERCAWSVDYGGSIGCAVSCIAMANSVDKGYCVAPSRKKCEDE